MHDDGCISPTRVLLVEDHEPFRKFIRSTLTKHQDLQVVAETGDGLDAVSKCLQLQPELVLMDIGLPGLNGIEAARRIRALVPACKIVFLTQEASPEIMQEAFNLGASSYVVKARAANDLIPAITAAREGRQFASQAAAPRAKLRPGANGIKEELDLNAASARPGAASSHSSHFHPDESSLLAEFVGFIEDKLKAQKVVMVIATEAHRHAILHTLRSRRVHLDLVLEEGRLVLLDVDEMLAKCMVDDLPDHARFFSAAGEVLEAVKAMNPGLRILVCGEIAPTLWARGNGAAAIQLELLWDKLARIYDLETLCGYMLTASQRLDSDTYNGICAAHSSIRFF